jgi:hypothetical protein
MVPSRSLTPASGSASAPELSSGELAGRHPRQREAPLVRLYVLLLAEGVLDDHPAHDH